MIYRNWISAWCSSTGTSHITQNLQCQDSSRVLHIENSDVIIAAISDGAGSCKNSHIGSDFLVEKVIEKTANTFKQKNWLGSQIEGLSESTWRQESFEIFKEIKNELIQKSYNDNLELSSLSATLIIVISNGNFIACANVGDGRAAFRNNNTEWKPLMTPTKGEEVNQTIFITSDAWAENIQSEYFGSCFYNEEITGFTLLSDGCERASFEILKYNEEENIYYDPNKPYVPFFEPNFQTMLQLKKTNINQEKINELWRNFLEKGNEILANEPDDKSMIISAYSKLQANETDYQVSE